LLAMVVGVVILPAQECTYYFPVKVGATLETKSYNDKDKPVSIAKSIVIEHSGNKIKFSSEVSDNKGKSISKGNYEIRCENNEVFLDMSMYLQGVNKDAYPGMDVKVESKSMSIPAVLAVGQKLNEGEITMKVSNQGFQIMNNSTRIFNRKVEALEDITTPAGTFKCAKITYEVETKIMGLIRTKGIQWISSKVGVVKTESYDQKGKLSGYTILTSYTE